MTARTAGLLLVCATLVAPASAEPMVWGIHAHNPSNIPAAAATGYTAIRLWDTRTTWADLAPAKNSLRPFRLATTLRESEKSRLKVLWTLGSTPRWASARPMEKCPYGFGCGAEPENIDDWRRYVQAMAKTYKGRIECYEPWNEVSFPHDPVFTRRGDGGDPEEFFTGSVASMVSLAQAAYEQIKQVAPEACVTTPSFHNSGNTGEKLDRYLAAGGGRYADAVSMHFYFGEGPEEVVPAIRGTRQILSRHGLVGMPIWNTEVGVDFSAMAREMPGLERPEIVYAMILRSYLLNASEGVARVYWYAWDNGFLGFFDRGKGADFGSAAAAAAVKLVDGLDDVKCRQNDSVWDCHASARGHRFRAVWLSGKTAKPRLVHFDKLASRWGRVPEAFQAGQGIWLDARPVIVEQP